MVTHSPHQCDVLPGLLDNLLSLQVFEEVCGLLVDGQNVVSLCQPSLGSTTPRGDLRTQREGYSLVALSLLLRESGYARLFDSLLHDPR